LIILNLRHCHRSKQGVDENENLPTRAEYNSRSFHINTSQSYLAREITQVTPATNTGRPIFKLLLQMDERKKG